MVIRPFVPVISVRSGKRPVCAYSRLATGIRTMQGGDVHTPAKASSTTRPIRADWKYLSNSGVGEVVGSRGIVYQRR